MPSMLAQLSPVALRRCVAVGLKRVGADAFASKPWQSMNG
jgi:hypothetical protein